ncbi:MAG: hypothetical protein A2287_07725 [Candidatus Melainabacteria bacterium RIFOXYA12_FULL_32_12]|nr:MAG: hypothetical protein A2255_00445 [Candidatus Melainabacteria bacterium RIFOXYA2_FULL_32_9]OGI25800.1 MAG: hypothetical protein A2287_07725 [Candidatus Melainabacteria bacterium RIFOXYA12_FULL_32_12]
MIVTMSKYKKLEKKYEGLLRKFSKYKQMYNYANCNKTWKYDQLMVRTIKLKRENDKNTYDIKQLEKLTAKLIEIKEERDYLKSEIDKIAQEEVSKRVNEEVNLVFKKNAKVNEELLQAKEEIKWVKWFLKSLKDIYLSENGGLSKRIILDKLREGIPECYREILEDVFENSYHLPKAQQLRAR